MNGRSRFVSVAQDGLVHLPRAGRGRRLVLRDHAAQLLAFPQRAEQRPESVHASQEGAVPRGWAQSLVWMMLMTVMVIFFGPALLFGPAKN